ncbi:MAG: dinitrogenase iron-molybdenum cofactor biosynthesis protein [Thermoprotei archaeon]|nr:MAG: dinitrogenase iron-molybdenum cofactor biosynthesis protein [Thermoprotei archaeon]
MKVAVSSAGKDLDSNVSNVFGRCPYFIIAEIENKKIIKTEAIENAGARRMSGAGISAAQTVAEKGVKAVITGSIGPRASDVLRQFNIEVYRGSGIVRDVLQEFIDNKLERIQ